MGAVAPPGQGAVRCRGGARFGRRPDVERHGRGLCDRRGGRHRNEAFSFDTGRAIFGQRANRSVDLLPNLELAPFQDIQWRSVLRSLYAMQGYQTAVQEPIDREPVLEFLFTSPTLPRAYRRCLEHIRGCLRTLPRNAAPLRTCNRMLRQLRQYDFSVLEGAALHEFVDQRQIDLATLHAEITRTYFQFRPRVARQKRSSRRA